jgi:hypothetical protein
VRPIDIGETWQQAIAKIIHLVTDMEVTTACNTVNLCASLQGGIEAAIHAIQAIWDSHHMEEEWGFLLIDAKNASMKWTGVLCCGTSDMSGH